MIRKVFKEEIGNFKYDLSLFDKEFIFRSGMAFMVVAVLTIPAYLIAFPFKVAAGYLKNTV